MTAVWVVGWVEEKKKNSDAQAVRMRNVLNDIYAERRLFISEKKIDLSRDARNFFLSPNANWESFISLSFVALWGCERRSMRDLW